MEDIMARIDHTTCTHPRTPAGRRACRAGIATVAPAPVVAKVDRMRDMLASMADEPVKLTGAVARRMARQAVAADRIQPRRGGARVPARSSSCVQAALHTGNSLCACGHRSGSFAA